MLHEALQPLLAPVVLISACGLMIMALNARAMTSKGRIRQLHLERLAVTEKLREAAALQKAAFLERLVGTEQNVLIERKDGYGHAENFADVAIADAARMGDAMIGTIVRSRIAGIENGKLVGETV